MPLTADQLLGKTVINQATGKQMGSISDVVFSADRRALVAVLIGNSGWGGQPEVLHWNAIENIGDVVLMQGADSLPALQEDEEVQALHQGRQRLTGTTILSANGEQIGSISDVFISERGQVTGFGVKQQLFGDYKHLPIEYVQAVGKDAVITTVPDASALLPVDTAEHEQGNEQQRPVVREHTHQQRTTIRARPYPDTQAEQPRDPDRRS